MKEDYIKWSLTLNGEQARQELTKLQSAGEKLALEQEKLAKKMQDVEQASGKDSKEFKNLENQSKSLQDKIQQNNQKMEALRSTMDKSKLTIGELQKHLKEMQKQLKGTSASTDPTRFKELTNEINKTKEALRAASGQTQSFSDAFRSWREQIVNGAMFAIGEQALNKLTSAFRGAFDTIKDFEAKNSELAAVLGTNMEAVKGLTDQAKELGRTTSYTASQVTGLQVELARLGFGMEDITNMTPAVMSFAKAVGTDLSSAATLSGAALRIFGLESTDIDRVVSTMAISTTKSAMSFDYLNNSLATIGPVANSFGFTIEDTAALLGVLANSGFDASSAATATRNILLNLADESGALAVALGGPVKNSEELAVALKQLNDEGIDLATALELTDKRSVAAFSSFLKNADSIAQLRQEVTGAEGDFQQMTQTMGDNVSGSLAGLDSAIEGLILQFYESRGAIKSIIDIFTSLVQWVSENITWISRLAAGIAALTTVSAIYTKHVIQNIALQAKSIAMTIKDTAAKVAAAVATFSWSKAWQALNATMAANPIGAVITAIVALVSVIGIVIDKMTSMSEGAKAVADAEREAIASTLEEEARITMLNNAIHNNRLKVDERRAAIAELQKIIPAYNATISEEGRLTNETTGAIKSYIEQLRQKALAQAMQAKMQPYYTESADIQQELEKARGLYRQSEKDIQLYNQQYNTLYAQGDMKRAAEVKKRLNEAKAIYGENYRIAAEQVAKQKELDKEWKDSIDYQQKLQIGLLKTTPVTPVSTASTETGTSTGKGTANSGKSSAKDTADKDAKVAAKTALDELKAEYDERIAAIKMMHEKELITDADFNKRKAAEDEAYAVKRLDTLAELSGKTKEEYTQTNEYLLDQQKKANTDMEQAVAAGEQAMVDKATENRDARLQLSQTFYDEQRRQVELAKAQGQISEQQAALTLKEIDAMSTQDRLKIAEDYETALTTLSQNGINVRKSDMEAATNEVKSLNHQFLIDTANVAQAVNQIRMVPMTEREQLETEYQAVVAQTTAMYDTLKLKHEEFGLSEQEIDRARFDALAQLAKDHEQKMEQLNEKEASNFEKNWAKKTKTATKTFSAINSIAGTASQLFSELQQGEIAESDAKYDAMIAAAKANGEDTTKLEEEKEQAKYDIQKKYADAQFVTTIAQIISQTALSIMQAYAQLGPIGGSIAAAVITALGIVQLNNAKQERDRIKNQNVTPSGSSAGEFSEGGYTGDGGRYEVAGIVHKGEYVVPQTVMNNPYVIDAIGNIEALRSQYSRANRLPGYADGGFTGGDVPDVQAQAVNVNALTQACYRLGDAVARLQDLRAVVSLQDLRNREKTDARARKVFSR